MRAKNNSFFGACLLNIGLAVVSCATSAVAQNRSSQLPPTNTGGFVISNESIFTVQDIVSSSARDNRRDRKTYLEAGIIFWPKEVSNMIGGRSRYFSKEGLQVDIVPEELRAVRQVRPPYFWTATALYDDYCVQLARSNPARALEHKCNSEEPSQYRPTQRTAWRVLHIVRRDVTVVSPDGKRCTLTRGERHYGSGVYTDRLDDAEAINSSGVMSINLSGDKRRDCPDFDTIVLTPGLLGLKNNPNIVSYGIAEEASTQRARRGGGVGRSFAIAIIEQDASGYVSRFSQLHRPLVSGAPDHIQFSHVLGRECSSFSTPQPSQNWIQEFAFRARIPRSLIDFEIALRFNGNSSRNESGYQVSAITARIGNYPQFHITAFSDCRRNLQEMRFGVHSDSGATILFSKQAPADQENIVLEPINCPSHYFKLYESFVKVLPQNYDHLIFGAVQAWLLSDLRRPPGNLLTEGTAIEKCRAG